MTGAAEDALPRVEPVVDPLLFRGGFGQHHETAHAGRRGCPGIPMRFLVANGRQQPPVDTRIFLRLPEQVDISRQALLYMLPEIPARHIVPFRQFVDISFPQLLQFAGVFLGCKKAIGCIAQAVIEAAVEQPVDGGAFCQRYTWNKIGQLIGMCQKLSGGRQGVAVGARVCSREDQLFRESRQWASRQFLPLKQF